MTKIPSPPLCVDIKILVDIGVDILTGIIGWIVFLKLWGG
eukprot:CAMPEP_0203732160 /NCGR_PEP_ID=MMETSP0092-20131115/24387_1 /ASSEMBLY_ACC=CAM_ASM_001090 /TAXON_ID=426623 /ORGANISM="Chaetoceros affinis, Strain CCMP159" /LENGTH=39 /DNA_ID= /DNA_START= /DNA_END= /DNA_ORIENTATION=